MIDPIYYNMLLASATGLCCVNIVPRALALTGRARALRIAAVFGVFFLATLTFLAGRSEPASIWTIVARSIGVGLIPLAGGWIYAYLTARPSGRDKS